jgi:hypothetical protein
MRRKIIVLTEDRSINIKMMLNSRKIINYKEINLQMEEQKTDYSENRPFRPLINND